MMMCRLCLVSCVFCCWWKDEEHEMMMQSHGAEKFGRSVHRNKILQLNSSNSSSSISSSSSSNNNNKQQRNFFQLDPTVLSCYLLLE